VGGRADRHAQPGRLAEEMRVIVCKERLHPGAELPFIDLGGQRFT
jgi:hypothetical protein